MSGRGQNIPAGGSRGARPDSRGPVHAAGVGVTLGLPLVENKNPTSCVERQAILLNIQALDLKYLHAALSRNVFLQQGDSRPRPCCAQSRQRNVPEACSNDLRPHCFRDSYESDGLSRKTYPNLRTTIEGRVCSTLPPPLGWSFMTLGKICPQLAFRATPNQTRRPLCPSSTTRLQPLLSHAPDTPRTFPPLNLESEVVMFL